MKQNQRETLLLSVAAVVAVALVVAACVAWRSKGYAEVPSVAEAESYQLYPDLCGLDSVLCDGERQVRITAYEAVTQQTDADPCISSTNDDICALKRAGTNVCATGLYQAGTELWVNGLGTCTVMDIQAPRYRHQIDWFCGEQPSSSDCVQRVMKIGVTSVVPL